MAALYGRLGGSNAKTEATRMGHSWLNTSAETWHSKVTVQVQPDRSENEDSFLFHITVRGKHGGFVFDTAVDPDALFRQGRDEDVMALLDEADQKLREASELARQIERSERAARALVAS